MNIKLYSIILVFTTLALTTQAQTIRGTVSDTSQTIIGATISVIGTGQKAGTNATGKYQLKLVKGGTYTVAVSYIGYQTQQKKITIAENETKDLDFQLLSNNNNLENVVVLGSRSAPRSNLDTPVPVDVVDIRKITQNIPQVSLIRS
ncbi:carboxypeptidase-like regulatory domain-containing protein [Pedobacter sp. NJ-S-72]